MRTVMMLAAETGISPRELERLDHDELITLVDVLNERSKG